MSSPLLCAACGGFVMVAAARCPHCDARPRPMRRLARFLATALLGVGATMTLMACYGAMPEPNECGYGGWCPDAAWVPPDGGRIGDAAVQPDAGPDATPDPCTGLDQPACAATDGCAPQFAGVNCTSSSGGTCTPDDCHCESYEYAGCVSVPQPP